MRFIDRMREEFDQLDSRRKKLGDFMEGAQFELLPLADQLLMQKQFEVMMEYIMVLAARLELARLRSMPDAEPE